MVGARSVNVMNTTTTTTTSYSLVITFSRLIFNPACGQLNGEKMTFPCPRSRHRIWSRATGSAVPFRVSPLILHAQAEFGAYSRAPLFPPAFHHGVISTPEKRHRVSLSLKLRSNGAFSGVDTTPWRKTGGKRGARECAPDSAWAWRMSGLTRDGTAEPVSRDQILRRERGQGKFIFSLFS